VNRFLILPALAAVICAVQAPAEQRDRVAAAARAAKNRGLSALDYWDGKILEYAEAGSLDDTIGVGGGPFLLEITRKRCSLTRDGNSIVSWYTARIIDDFGSRHVPAPIVREEGWAAPPAEMTPIPGDSLLIVQPGGAVNIDGVVVRSQEEDALLVGERYLIFLNFSDNRDGTLTRVASPQVEHCTYTYDERTDRFKPVGGKGDDPLTTDMVRRSGGSFRALLNVLKAAVAAK